ncbi:gliding motility-associated C-terminal domain-containing protein, partial [Litoribacter ruber]|uniref:T9SS type B sorting domain-containing protein n=1 Tax=Litoribacter ruber TaxID=702568 RepID=UPI001BDA1DF0
LGNYEVSNENGTLTVTKALTSIFLVNSIANCDGGEVTLTATVSSSAQFEVNNTGGKITFKNNGNSIGTFNESSVTNGVFSGKLDISLALGALYDITAEFVPNSSNLSGSQTSAPAQLTILQAFINSNVAANSNGNVVIFDGAASSLGLPSSTVLTATYKPSGYPEVSYKWYSRNVEGNFSLISGETKSTFKVVANGDFTKEYMVELIVDGKCVGNTIFSKIVSVEASCGNGNGNQTKVQVCHVTPNGKRNTICVSANAVDALLTNSPGSFIGSCNISYREGEEPGFEDTNELLADLVNVTWKTSFEELQTTLNKIGGELMKGDNAQFKWFSNGYDPIVAGFYEINGEVVSANARNIGSIIIPILVEDKSLPTNILLSSQVIAKGITAGTSIADLSTVDEADDVHEYGLDSSLLDNSFFSIVNGRLTWNSTEHANSKPSYQVAIQTTDRVGNMISRNFTLYPENSGLAEIEIFNTFTPDNDGVNDTWGIKELIGVKDVRIIIFDRAGNQVFQTNDPSVYWDGKQQGRNLPVGAYFYVVEYGRNGDVRRGTLNLLRK